MPRRERPLRSFSAPQGSIFQIKVRLLGISPMIWRRVLVPTSLTLHELHGVIQAVMGWEGLHLFQFQVRAVAYGSFDLMIENPAVPLESFGFRKNEKFAYIYDGLSPSRCIAARARLRVVGCLGSTAIRGTIPVFQTELPDNLEQCPLDPLPTSFHDP